MAIEVTLTGARKLEEAGVAAVEARRRIRKEIGEAVSDFALRAVGTIKRDYLSGPRPEKLGVLTGRLRSSIRFALKESDNEISVSLGTDVPYAAIHEKGGPVERGRKTIQMKARPFMQPGVEDELPRLEKQITDVLAGIAQGGFGGE